MTRSMSRLPLSFWLFFSILTCYISYNPWFSMSDFIQMPVFWGIKVVVAGFYCGILLLYLTEGSKTLSPMGLLVMASIIAGAVVTLLNANLLSLSSAGWWIQIPLGIAMFFSLRWGAIYRSITGRVAVTQSDDQGHHHAN